MSESSTTPPEDGQPLGLEQFAADTIRSVEFGDAIAEVLEERVTLIEECIAAPWYRRWLLWRRLRREIRASVATWPGEYIPRDDFRGRRWEWAAYTAGVRYDRTGWKPEFGPGDQPRQDAPEDGSGQPGEGGQEPGAGFLP